MTPLFPRDVLYLLGGECLHYMPDEEISAYQELDELRSVPSTKVKLQLGTGERDH
jgi:hypothetical protein